MTDAAATEPRPGPTNSLTDVHGLRVGHSSRVGDGWLTGTTVVRMPTEGVVAGVDVRGGGPGTRETDLLDPRNLVERVHAITLSGGSAFGLAAADGVMSALFDDGIGFPMGSPGDVVPIVPGAVIFDLGRGGRFAAAPDASFGRAAYDAGHAGPVEQGVVGAGTGAKAGGLKGGVGSASTVLTDGTTIAALVVVNAVGSCVDSATGQLYAVRYGFPGEFPTLPPVVPDRLAAARAAAALDPSPLKPALATTIGVIATDATLTKAQCAKMSGIGHDGFARGIRPVHTMFDGDTLFTVATGAKGADGIPDPFAFHAMLDAAGDAVTRAIAHAMLAATTVTTPAGTLRSYLDALHP